MPQNSYKPALFWLILLAGMALRFHGLDRQSLWDDEMSTIHTISTQGSPMIRRFATYETHPPLYFLQLRLWSMMGLRSLVKLRANSALWGSLSLFLMYLVARRYGGEPMALLAMALLTFSPFHLAYSQEMRPYSFTMALSLGALLAVERRRWFGVGAFWTAVLYSHYWGAFIVAAQASYAYWTVPKEERKPVIAAFLTASVLFAFWLPILYQQLGVIDRLVFWAPAFSVASLGKVFLAYSGILFNLASWTFYLPARVWLLAVIGIFFAAAFWQGLLKGPRAAILWLGVGLGIPWLLSIWKATIFVWYRYPVLMFPAFVILTAAGCLSLRSKVWRTALITACLTSQWWGCWVYFHQWQKANPKAVVQYVHWLRTAKTIVIRPAYFSDLFGFYDQGTTVTLDEDTLDSPEKRRALSGYQIILLAFDVPADPVVDALLSEYKQESARYFPGLSHLGVTVYQLR